MKTTAKPAKKEASIVDMKEEVNDLKKLLENCFPQTGFKFPRTYRFDAVAHNIMKSVFQTATVFIPVESKSAGKYVERHKKYVWDNLRRELYRDNSDINDYWLKPAFRRGLQLVEEAYRELSVEFGCENNGQYTPVDAADLANFFLHDNHESNIEAIECLLEVIPKLKMDTDDTVDAMLCLSITLLILKLDGIERVTDDEDDDDGDELETAK